MQWRLAAQGATPCRAATCLLISCRCCHVSPVGLVPFMPENIVPAYKQHATWRHSCSGCTSCSVSQWCVMGGNHHCMPSHDPRPKLYVPATQGKQVAGRLGIVGSTRATGLLLPNLLYRYTSTSVSSAWVEWPPTALRNGSVQLLVMAEATFLPSRRVRQWRRPGRRR